MKNIKRSLGDYIPKNYHSAVCMAASYTTDLTLAQAEALIKEETEFFPKAYQERLEKMLSDLGKEIIAPVKNPVRGAGTSAFEAASHLDASPLSAMGPYRIGEDGRLYYAAKSEHYHIPLGHNFPGYALIETASKLGIDNATHNNTRGFFTRKLERELVRTTNNIARGDEAEIDRIISSDNPSVLNRVLNLNTGSLAAEAGFKLFLARFYRSESAKPDPEFKGLTPVILCMADYDGGGQSNYHGTTIMVQSGRGLWPEMSSQMDKSGILKYVPVTINDFNDFSEKFHTYNQGQYRIAGFVHEIILMNFSALRLTPEYLHQCYDLCHQNNVPVMVDEVQSGAWYPELFLFKRFGLDPDMAVIGKGFSGGFSSASHLILNEKFDALSQFGALVTNGQQELSALSYLITLDFIEENTAEIEEAGQYFETALRNLAMLHPHILDRFHGEAHMGGLCFHDHSHAVDFCKILNCHGIDISTQTYKSNCPPTALLKLPLISSRAEMDQLLKFFQAAVFMMEEHTSMQSEK